MMIVLRARRTGMWILAAVNLALVCAFGYLWLQGDPRPIVRTLTVVPAVFLALKAFLLTKPVELRLAVGRLEGRLGWGPSFSTSCDNVLRLEKAGDRVLLEFKDVSAVEASDMARKMFVHCHNRGGAHLRLPINAAPADIERLRAAVSGAGPIPG